MSKFKVGMKVNFIRENEMLTGVIENVFDNTNIAIVSIPDDAHYKVRFEEMAIAPEPELKTEEKPIEPVEKSEITITPNEFMEICLDTVMDETKGRLLAIALLFTDFCSKLHERLFIGESEND